MVLTTGVVVDASTPQNDSDVPDSVSAAADTAPSEDRRRQRLIDLLQGLGLRESYKHLLIVVDAIAACSVRHPQHREHLFDALGHLWWRRRPTVPDCVVRAHADELLERVVKDEPLQPATRAEIMLVLSETSLRAPLEHDAVLVYTQIFQRIFGEDRIPELPKPIALESWPHRARVIFAEIQHRARDDSRKSKRRATSARHRSADHAKAP